MFQQPWSQSDERGKMGDIIFGWFAENKTPSTINYRPLTEDSKPFMIHGMFE